MTFLDTSVRFVFAMLLNGLWEAALVALAAWCVLRIMRKTNATTRHTILVTALLVAIALPAATAVLSLPRSQSPLATATHIVVPQAASLRSSGVTGTAGADATSVAKPRPHVSVPRMLMFAVVGAWLLGAAVIFVRLAVSLLHLEQLKRDALPVTPEYRAQLRRWDHAARGTREVRLCRCAEIAIPIAVGLFDSMILLPEHLLEELEPADIDQIVVHELAHLRRRDDWINAIERVAQAVFFFNPGVLWIISQLDLEREVACDDWVLQQEDALPYANCLAKVVETTAWPHRAMSAPGAFVTRRAMSLRIERILSKHRDVRVRSSPVRTGIAIATFGALCVAAAVVSPSFAMATPSPAAQPSASPAGESYIDQLDAAGYRGLSVDELVRLKTIGVTGAYIEQIRQTGYRYTDLQTIMQMRTMGITPDYLRGLIDTGYGDIRPGQLEELRAIGVDAAYIRLVKAHGFNHLTIVQLINLKTMGVFEK